MAIQHSGFSVGYCLVAVNIQSEKEEAQAAVNCMEAQSESQICLLWTLGPESRHKNIWGFVEEILSSSSPVSSIAFHQFLSTAEEMSEFGRFRLITSYLYNFLL